jgi:hypothetical protein
MPRERRSRPTAPGNGVKNGPRARQNPLLGAEFYPGAIPVEALVVMSNVPHLRNEEDLRKGAKKLLVAAGVEAQ